MFANIQFTAEMKQKIVTLKSFHLCFYSGDFFLANLRVKGYYVSSQLVSKLEKQDLPITMYPNRKLMRRRPISKHVTRSFSGFQDLKPARDRKGWKL